MTFTDIRDIAAFVLANVGLWLTISSIMRSHFEERIDAERTKTWSERDRSRLVSEKATEIWETDQVLRKQLAGMAEEIDRLKKRKRK